MTSHRTSQSETLLTQLQELSHPVAVFLPGMTQHSLEDPEIRGKYLELQEQMEDLRSRIMQFIGQYTRGKTLTPDGEQFLMQALPLAKQLSTMFRLHMIKISSGRMQDLDYTKIRNAKYKEENIPSQPFVQEQLKLMRCKAKDLNTHHIDKRSQYGISLPSLLMPIHKGIHTLLHMTTDNNEHEQQIQHFLVPKKERELHSHKRRLAQTQNVVGNHEAISRNLYESSEDYIQRFEQFPQKVEDIRIGYSRRQDRGKNENYQAACAIKNQSVAIRNKMGTIMLDGLLESLPGYMDTALIMNTLDVKDQFLAHLAATIHHWNKYEQRMTLAAAMYQEKRVPKYAKTLQANTYMEENWLTHESKIRRPLKRYMLEQLHLHHQDIPDPDAQLRNLFHTLTQLQTILPKYIPFRASDPVLGKVRGFNTDHGERIRTAHTLVKQVLDTHDLTPFSQIFHDTLHQPLIILESHIELLEREHLLQRPRSNGRS